MPATLEYARYINYVRNILRRRGRTREEAEDLVQEAFLRMEQYCQEGNKVVAPEAFVMRTALNLSVSEHRRRQRFPFAGQTNEEIAPDEAVFSPDEILAAEERLERIKQILDAVSRRTRDIFFLHRLGGFSYAEIAQRCGVTVSAIEKHIATATATLALERQNHER